MVHVRQLDVRRNLQSQLAKLVGGHFVCVLRNIIGDSRHSSDSFAMRRVKPILEAAYCKKLTSVPDRHVIEPFVTLCQIDCRT
jgi:hypothetical protein